MIEIRPLGTSDWEIYRDIRLDALKQDQKAFGSSYEEESIYDPETWKKFTMGVSCAFDNKRAVGMIVVFFNTRIKYRHIAEIFGVYVLPQYRGQRIGALLMDHALQVIRKNKSIIKVKLTVNATQEHALRLYKKFGFQCVGVMKKEMYVANNFYDEELLEKIFE